MTSYAKYPYATLLSVGSKLGTISDQLDSNDKGASSVNGLSGDQQSIADGIDDFRDEWGESIKKLKGNIGNFGTLSIQIGKMVGGADAELAKAMRPGGSGGTSA
jgi:hypothetical protein